MIVKCNRIWGRKIQNQVLYLTKTQQKEVREVTSALLYYEEVNMILLPSIVCSEREWIATYSRSIQEMCRYKWHGLELRRFRPWSALRWCSLWSCRMVVSGLWGHKKRNRIQGSPVWYRRTYQGKPWGKNQVMAYIFYFIIVVRLF